MKLFGLELKFNGFDILHKGIFDPDDKSDVGHIHDDRYYTETEVNALLSGKANTSHGNHVPTTETADNSRFLRNDNTWQDVTPANIGAAPTSHDHSTIINTDSALYVSKPGGGSYTTGTSAVTGAIQITLPQYGPNTMLRFIVDIFDYATGETFTVMIAGYAYSSTSWTNCTASIIADNTNRNFTVRFGHNGSKSCVWIGETSSSWSYPKVIVRDFFAGHSNYSASQWQSGWAVSFVTAFGTVGVTQSNNFVVSDWNKLVNKPSTFAPSTHTHVKSQITDMPTKLSEFENDIGAGGGIKITTSPTEPTGTSPTDFWYKEV